MKRRTLLSALTCIPCWPHARAMAQTGGAHHGGHAGKRARLAMSAAFAPDGTLWIVGLNDRQQLFVEQSRDDGASWSSPRVIDTVEDVIAAEGENRPKLAFGPNRWVVIAYTQPLSKPYTGAIRMLRSTDGGASFPPPLTVHQDRRLIAHRFESIAFDATGALHTFWIDKRDLEAATLKGGDDACAGAAIYRNVSLDGGRTFGRDTKLADHSCECCRIVERFDLAAWGRLQRELPRPSVVVFTATYCASCPAVLAKLSGALKGRGIEGDVVAVVIDEAEEQQLLKSEHYTHASRLFLFEGNEASVRYHVDPRWRGVTPYIVFLPAKGKTEFTAGAPSDPQVEVWLGK